MLPPVTIGIAFRNPGRFFETAIQSVFAQTTQNWELLLFDDGSTDGSVELAKSIRDHRVSLCLDGQSRGLNVRLNQMVSAASCEYFARMDADDVMHPDRIRRQLEALTDMGPGTVVGSAAFCIDAEGRIRALKPASPRQRTGFKAAQSFHHPTVIAHTEWFRANPYTEDIFFHRCQDAELWCRTSQSTRFVNLSEPLLFYREMGAFSYRNYMSTAVGRVALARSFTSDSRFTASVRLTYEMSKIWLYGLADILGIADALIRTRNRPLSEDESRAAQAILDRIRQQVLPI